METAITVTPFYTRSQTAQVGARATALTTSTMSPRISTAQAAEPFMCH